MWPLCTSLTQTELYLTIKKTLWVQSTHPTVKSQCSVKSEKEKLINLCHFWLLCMSLTLAELYLIKKENFYWVQSTHPKVKSQCSVESEEEKVVSKFLSLLASMYEPYTFMGPKHTPNSLLKIIIPLHICIFSYFNFPHLFLSSFQIHLFRSFFISLCFCFLHTFNLHHSHLLFPPPLPPNSLNLSLCRFFININKYKILFFH